MSIFCHSPRSLDIRHPPVAHADDPIHMATPMIATIPMVHAAMPSGAEATKAVAAGI